MARIFISYKRADKEIVFPLKDQIEAAIGKGSCWIDLEGIESDAVFANVIIKAIKRTEVFLFMYSATHSAITDYENDWTVKEINFAQKQKKRIVFVNLDNTPLSDYFEMLFGLKQQVDAMSSDAFNGLLKDLAKWLDIKTEEVPVISHPLPLQPKTEVPKTEKEKEKGPKKLRKSVYIGLGGIGVQTVLQTKAILMENVGKDWELPPLLEFLAVDLDVTGSPHTAFMSNGDGVTFHPREIADVSIPNPIEYFKHIQKKSWWMPPQNVDYVNELSSNSTGMVRSNGRLAFMAHQDNLRSQLRAAFYKVTSTEITSEKWSEYASLSDGIGSDSIEVNIVSSLCGGTGSGMLMDMAYLINEVAREMNLSVTVNGFFVLPDIIEATIEGDVNKIRRMRANTYATLHELDFLMDRYRERRIVKLPSLSHNPEEVPFHSVSLFGNKGKEGGRLMTLNEQMCAISNALVLVTGGKENTTTSIGDDIWNDFCCGAYDVENKYSWITPVGISTIGLNLDVLDKKYRYLAQNDFIKKLLSEHHDIALSEGVLEKLQEIGRYRRREIPVDIEKEYLRPGNIMSYALSIIDQRLIEYLPSQEEMDQATEQMCDKAKRTLIDREEDLCRISLGDTMAYLNAMLKQLKEEMIIPLNQKLADAPNEEDKVFGSLREETESMERYMRKPKFLRSKSTEVDYFNEVVCEMYSYMQFKQSIYYTKWNIKYYTYLSEFIQAEIQKIQHKIDVFADIERHNTDIINNIVYKDDSFDINVTAQMESMVHPNDIYEISIDDYLHALPHNSLYSEEDDYVYLAALHDCLRDERLGHNKSKLSMDLFLQKLSKKEMKDLLTHMDTSSTPSVDINGHGYMVPTQGQFVGQQGVRYVGVPDVHTSAIVSILKDVIFDSDCSFTISTGLEDRIIVYKCKRSIPAFTLQSMEKYKSAYENESKQMAPYMDEWWRREMADEGFSLLPKKERRDEALEAWVMGCILGMVKFEQESYWYQTSTMSLMSSDEMIWSNTREQSRAKAFEVFAGNEQLIEKYLDCFHQHLMALGMSAAHQLEQDVLENYFSKYSRCPIKMQALKTKAHKETMDMLTDETMALREIFAY